VTQWEFPNAVVATHKDSETIDAGEASRAIAFEQILKDIGKCC